ncbi:hypothetical protein ROZALSC1DRAFT_21502 [Rozella allomycis CSF55]|nr:hypothetical protein ROZALSC1DRAFT_21502 [Rozella allomycis CSF55]
MIFTLWQTNLEHVHSFTRLVLSLADEFNLTLQTLINHLFELPKIYFNEARFNQFIALKYYNAYRIMNSFYKHNIINAQFIIEQLLLLKNQSSYNEISATAYRILSDGIIFPPNVQISELN